MARAPYLCTICNVEMKPDDNEETYTCYKCGQQLIIQEKTTGTGD